MWDINLMFIKFKNNPNMAIQCSPSGVLHRLIILIIKAIPNSSHIWQRTSKEKQFISFSNTSRNLLSCFWFPHNCSGALNLNSLTVANCKTPALLAFCIFFPLLSSRLSSFPFASLLPLPSPFPSHSQDSIESDPWILFQFFPFSLVYNTRPLHSPLLT